MTTMVQGVVITMFEAICCFIFFDIFLEQKIVNKWPNKIRFCFLMIGFLLISLLKGDNYLLKILLVLLLIIVIMYAHYRKFTIQIIFLTVGFYALVFAIDYIIVAVIQFIADDSIWILPFRSTVLALLSKAVLLFVVILLSRKFNKTGSLNLISDSEWIRFLFFPILTIISLVGFTVGGASIGNLVLLCSFGLVIANFLIYLIIRDIVQRERDMQEMRISEERAKSRVNMYLSMNESYSEQKKRVHEFKNQRECIQQLLRTKEYEKAEEYINSICNIWDGEMDYVNTNHPIINAIVNQKYKIAKSKGIAVVLSFSDLANITISDEDLVTLLANLLDNAIEASEKVTKVPKIIKFKFTHEGGKITVSMRNPVEHSINMSGQYPETTKKNPADHGIGMRNIEAVIKRYGGEHHYGCNNGFFTYTIIFRKVN